MVGDVIVKFVIQGPAGNTVVLNRQEAERLLQALKVALKTGQGSEMVIYPLAGEKKR